MTIVMIVLGAIMASFAVLGYLHGTRSAVLTLLAVVGGLAVIALAGGRIINLINGIWRVVMAGGLQTLSSGGDLAALRARMAGVPPLSPANAAGAALLLLLTVIILFAVLLGRHRRFRRPPSGLGLIVGLVSGYLVGAYLLDLLLPSLVTVLPLPFGLANEIAGGRPAPAPGTLPVGDLGAQLLRAVTSASQASLNAAAMVLVVSIILLALLANAGTRGGARGGGGAGGGRGAPGGR